MTTPDWVLRTLRETDPAAPVILLLRHAERGPLPPGRPGGDVPLLPEGLVAAGALGRVIGPRLAQICTSPVLRCVQTAAAVRQGADSSVELALDRVLGDPGVFVTDSALAWSTWKRLGHKTVMTAAIAGSRLPGMAEPREAARRLRDHALKRAEPMSGVHVFVTHDSLLAPTVAHTLGLDLPPSEWPFFLEALVLMPRADGVVVRWRSDDGLVPRI